MKALLTSLGISLLLLLAACAPTADPERVSIQQLTESLSFYPQETGATWEYLAEGDPVTADPLYKRVAGPASIDGEVGIVWHTVGRGIDTFTVRQYRDDGVFRTRVSGPGYVTTLKPPIKEFPGPNELVVGSSWGGTTEATIVFTDTQKEDRRRKLTVNYRYQIVDQRDVTVEGGTFNVFVINLDSESVDETGEVVDSKHQELWFSPYVGEIRTPLGYYLMDTNFVLEQEQSQPEK